MTAAFVVAFALLNCFRGRGWVRGDRILACLGFGLCAWLYTDTPHLGVAVAAGTYLWALPAWGRMFSAIHGRDDPDDRCVGWIDRICFRLLPWDGTASRNRLRGMLWGSLRGLYLYPLFVALAVMSDPWALLIGLGCLLQGPAYRLVGCLPERESSGAEAELLTAAVFGGMLAACLT